MEIFGTSTPVKAMDLTFSECLDNSDVVALVGEPVNHFGQNAGRGRHGQSQGKPTHKTFTKEFEGQEVTVRSLAHPKPAAPSAATCAASAKQCSRQQREAQAVQVMFYLRGSRSEATVKAEVREPSTPSAPVSHCSPSLEREGVQVHQSGGFMGFFTTMSVARCWVEDARSRSASQPTVCAAGAVGLTNRLAQ